MTTSKPKHCKHPFCKNPVLKDGWLFCSHRCAVSWYDTHLPKGMKKGRATARVVAGYMGKRSLSECRFIVQEFEDKGRLYEYEVNTWTYEVHETKKYTVDFTLQKVRNRKGQFFYIEYKGKLDRDARKKMILMKKQHPKLDIRFVFEKPNNKISKNSKTRYWMWAEKNGFLWADNCIPEDWYDGKKTKAT
jgi:hypothetical protein